LHVAIPVSLFSIFVKDKLFPPFYQSKNATALKYNAHLKNFSYI